MEFEQLHEMFEDTEFTGLEVTGTTQTDIIQNALLTAGIENGLTSPSVTDSDSVVTISEADINSFSIGFIPDSNWTGQDGQTLSETSTPTTDPFYPTSLPSDLSQTEQQSQTIVTTTSQALQQSSGGPVFNHTDSFQNIAEPIKVEDNPYPNMTGENNLLWETTETQTTVSPNISTTLNSIIKAEPMLTSTSTDNFVSTSVAFNGICTENTYSMPNNDVTLPQDTLYTPILSQAIGPLSGNNQVDFTTSFIQTTTNNTTITVHGQQNYIDLDGLGSGYQPTTINGNAQTRPGTQRGTETWVDDPTLPSGWKTRQHFRETSPMSTGNKVDTYYMSQEGRQFRSKWRIVEYMETLGTYCKEEIEWVKTGIQTPRPTEPLRNTLPQVPKERSDKL